MAASAPVMLSPEWWLNRLYTELSSRRQTIDVFASYYEGDHPLPWIAPQARDEFRRIMRMTSSNYMGLVVDAMVERCKVEGFRLAAGSLSETPGDTEDVDALDADTWRIWQANDMDAGFDSVLLESAINGMSYLFMEPNLKDPSTPFIYPEHPAQAIVAYRPGTGRRDRVAGLKAWVDDWTGQVCATLQLPGNVYKFQAKVGSPGSSPEWSRREVVGETWGGKNVAGEVTLVEIPNNPRMLSGGVSELAGGITFIQDRINKTILDRLMTQDYGAFPQKWIKGWPTEDEAGNPVSPIDVGRNRVITSEAVETEFGQFSSAPLDPYSAAKREDVKDIASRTRTPAQYLLGEMSNVSGDTLQASQSGLVAKCRSRMRTWGEGAEDAVRVARRLAKLPDAGAQGMETIWNNPEFRTLGELTDSLVKKLQVGAIDVRQFREDAGYSATQIDRMEEREKQNAQASVDLRNRSMLSAIQDMSTPPGDQLQLGQ